MKFRFCFCLILIVLLAGYSMGLADSFIEAEAGISCSTKLDSADIIVAASAYKNIEAQTEDYIIGSVALKDYGEIDAEHVYLANTGEMIAYYLKEDPVGKIIDWRHDQTGALAGSKLEDAMKKICDAMSVSLPAVKYYDFRYPEATDIKIIVDEKNGGTDGFKFQIPANHILVHAEWSLAVRNLGPYNSSCSGGPNSLTLDEVSLVSKGRCSGWCDNFEGNIDLELLTYDNDHDFKVTAANGHCRSYGALILLYYLES